MENIIEVEGLNKKFPPDTHAIVEFNLQVKKGITFGLLGPNGSGKTTLIRILVGILKLDSGRVVVIDESLSWSERAKRIGYMTQVHALYQDLTVAENLDFFATIYGLSTKEKKKRVEELVSLVKLEGKEKSPVATLSGGMRQRVSLVASLLHKPQLVFLDEPTVGIDPALRIEFWDYFRKLNKEGTSIVLSTHVMEEAARCDELALLRDGRLLAQGKVEELLAETKTKTLEEAFLALEAP
ncbi:MAG TPA: ABC transporter ATP-binding protein [Candidatus Nanoarchaeia archaeon]